MIRFIFPNVDTVNELFMGKGVMISISKKVVDDKKYEVNTYDVTKSSEIKTIAEKYAGKQIRGDWRCFAEKSKKIYQGPSMGLAYLMSEIQRSRQLNQQYDSDEDIDIWFTGQPKLNPAPALSDFDPNALEIKLKGFINKSKDNLFFIPNSSLDTELELLCDEKEIQIIKFLEFSKLNKNQIFSQRRIVKVNADELEQLVDAFFKKPADYRYWISLKNLLIFMAITVLAAIGYYVSYQTNKLRINERVKTEARLFHQKVYQHHKKKIGPEIYNKNHPPPTYKLKPDILYKGSLLLTNTEKIIGMMCFSHIKSDHWFYMDEQDIVRNTNTLPMDVSESDITIIDYRIKKQADFFYYCLLKNPPPKNNNKDIFDHNHLPSGYTKDPQISFHGFFHKQSNGIITGQMSFSHPLSNTLFILKNDGTMNRQLRNTTLELDEISFVWIPGGCYLMGCGSTHSISCAEFESYQHVVCVDGFWISSYEITQKKVVVGDGRKPFVFF
jgi:hypothetical protein